MVGAVGEGGSGGRASLRAFPKEARRTAARPNEAGRRTGGTPSSSSSTSSSSEIGSSSAREGVVSVPQVAPPPSLRPWKKEANDMGFGAGGFSPTATPSLPSCDSRCRMRSSCFTSFSAASCDLSRSSTSVIRSISRSIASGVSICSRCCLSCSESAPFSDVSCATCTSLTCTRRLSSSISRSAIARSVPRFSARWREGFIFVGSEGPSRRSSSPSSMGASGP